MDGNAPTESCGPVGGARSRQRAGTLLLMARGDGRGRPASAASRARQLAAATPAHRDRYVDLLRAVAILAVVLGHWLISAVTVTDGRLGGVNLLYVVPWAPPVSWLFQVMPLFFLVGGFANAASLASHRRGGGTAAGWLRSRALRLLRPTAVLVGVLVLGYAVAVVAGADPEVTRTAVWLAGVGLWFLVVYLAVVALAPAVIAWQHRWGAAVVIGVLVAVVGAGDVARAVTGSDVPALGSYVAGWLAVHQLGVAWRDGALTRTRRPALLLAVGGAAAAIALVALGPYGVAMVGAVPEPELSNSDPPTLALLALAAAQAGVVLFLRPVVEPWLRRPRVWGTVVAANAVILTVFLWHMVAVVVAGAALIATGVFPQPEVGSGAWFALRVPWLLVLAVLLTALVAVLARVETAPVRPPARAPSGVAVWSGVLACVAALAGIGVTGVDGVFPPIAGLPLGELAVFGAGLAVVWRSGGRADDGAPAGSP